jgi:hypothetical protein
VKVSTTNKYRILYKILITVNLKVVMLTFNNTTSMSKHVICLLAIIQSFHQSVKLDNVFNHSEPRTAILMILNLGCRTVFPVQFQYRDV